LYAIPWHATVQINVILVLQSCTNPLEILPGPSSETFPVSSDVACNFSDTDFEEDVDVKDVFPNMYIEVDAEIKQELIPEDKSFPNIKSEIHEVS
jgi:hypothetical protein